MFYFTMAPNYKNSEIADLNMTKRSPIMCPVKEKVGYTPVMYRNESIAYMWLMHFSFTYWGLGNDIKNNKGTLYCLGTDCLTANWT